MLVYLLGCLLGMIIHYAKSHEPTSFFRRKFRVLNAARSCGHNILNFGSLEVPLVYRLNRQLKPVGLSVGEHPQHWAAHFRISNLESSAEMRCRFLAMPILLARCSDQWSQPWRVLMAPDACTTQLQLRRNISGRSRMGSRKDQRGEKPGAVFLKPLLGIA